MVAVKGGFEVVKGHQARYDRATGNDALALTSSL